MSQIPQICYFESVETCCDSENAHALYQRGVTNQNANWADDDAAAT
jgi:hypothetical protein